MQSLTPGDLAGKLLELGRVIHPPNREANTCSTN